MPPLPPRELAACLPPSAEIFACQPAALESGVQIGRSREGRPLRVFRLGTGALRVSLIAGAHADEPVGPRFLRHLVAWLEQLPEASPARRDVEWWIVPHLNPDGEARNSWYDGGAECEIAAYLTGAVREAPGDDIEFGFPRHHDDHGARPENQALWTWWRSAPGPFHLHASLHGMAFGGGPWFLCEPGWRDRLILFRRRLALVVHELGHQLHDVERGGEKGFFRIERGFATRPDSALMAQYFRDRGDEATASLFRPSSMETIRSLGGDPLTLVSECPLFITPGVGDEIGPPDPRAVEWARKIDAWRTQLARGQDPARIRACSAAGCLAALPVATQMTLQWEMILAGIKALVAPAEHG